MSFANPRGELRIKHILERIFDTELIRHVPVKSILSEEQCKFMSPSYTEKELDLWMPTRRNIFEINHGHKNKAQQKEKILESHLLHENISLNAIESRECPHLFAEMAPTWDDWIEVIGELKRNGINEKGEKIGK